MLRTLGVGVVVLALAPAAQAALSVSASVEPAAHAAAFRWTVSPAARVTIEVGRTGDFGITLRTPKHARSADRVLLGSLEPATTYRYRVTATRGPAVVRSIGSFTTNPFPSWTVGAVIDSTPHVDGQPFFRRMVTASATGRMRRASTPASTCTWAAAAAPPGCSSTRFVDARCRRSLPHGRTSPTVAGRSGGSISTRPPGGPPEALPFHPPWQKTHRVTFLTLSGHVYSGSAGIPAGRSVYPRFIARADMIGFDLFPLQVWCRRDAFQHVYAAQRELAALAGPRATYQWVEVGRVEICGARPELDPTPLTVRAETHGGSTA